MIFRTEDQYIATGSVGKDADKVDYIMIYNKESKTVTVVDQFQNKVEIGGEDLLAFVALTQRHGLKNFFSADAENEIGGEDYYKNVESPSF